MRNNKYIQVIWVENDPLITSAYPNEADMVAGIELHPFECWEDAETELQNNYDRWDAIILDAKCKYKKNDADKAEKFLSHVFPKIMTLAARKKRTIPWYVLSGQGEDDIRDLIPDTNEWDNDWMQIKNRRFYSKNGKVNIGGTEIHERHALFYRIKTHVTHYQHELQIKQHYYPDVFSAIDRLGLQNSVGYYLMALLEPIHFQDTTNANYNHRYVDLRKSLEIIFRHMVNNGILPPVIIKKSNIKENVNLSWSNLLLGTKKPTKINDLPNNEKILWCKVTRNTENPILPKQLAHWLMTAIFQAGGAVHTTTGEEEITLNLDNYLPHVAGSPYMLRSLTMGLCDFILWYDSFLTKHPDPEINANNFWTLSKPKP